MKDHRKKGGGVSCDGYVCSLKIPGVSVPRPEDQGIMAVYTLINAPLAALLFLSKQDREFSYQIDHRAMRVCGGGVRTVEP